MNNITKCAESKEELEKKLHEALEAYRKADIKRIRYQRETEHLEDTILDLMKALGYKTHEDSELGITVTYHPEAHKIIADPARIRAEHPELWCQYTKDSAVRERVTVLCYA